MKIYILTGAIGSGKTTSLFNWIKNRNDIDGILSPVIQEKRFFYSIKNRSLFNMEANENEDFFEIGKYRFSKKAFLKASDYLIKANANQNKWLILDEAGPLELKNEGFNSAIVQILSDRINLKLIFVVREKLVESFIKYFSLNISEVKIISNEELNKLK